MKRLPLPLLFLILLLVAGCDRRSGGTARVDEAEARTIYRTLLSGEGDASDSGGTQQQRTGWASIRGKVRLEGDAPAPKRLSVNRDQSVCAPGGAAVFSDDIVVGPNGELANFVIYARDVTEDNVHPEAQGDTSEVEFDQKQCIFESHVQVMQTTQKLKIVNSDSIGHNTNIDASKAGKFNQNISGGGSALYQPKAAESQPAGVSCSIHPWMKAYLLPLDNAYGASSTPDGAFEIENLPAGVEVELQLWHELGNVPEVVINGKKEKLKRGRLTLILSPDEDRELDIVVPASAFK